MEFVAAALGAAFLVSMPAPARAHPPGADPDATVVIAYDASSGRKLWTDGVPGVGPTYACGAHTVCFLPKEGVMGLDSATGAKLWKIPGGPAPYRRFAATPRAVFLGDDSLHGIHSFSIPEAKPLWTATLPAGGFGVREPGAAEGLLLLVQNNGTLLEAKPTTLVALDQATGKKKWDHASPPIDTYLAHGGKVFVSDEYGGISALDARDGHPLWRIEVSSALPKDAAFKDHFGEFVPAGPLVFVAHTYGFVWEALAVRGDGTIAWRVQGPIDWRDFATWAHGPGVRSGDSVALSFGQGVLKVFDSRSGRLRYALDHESEEWAVAGNQVFFSSTVGRVESADLATGARGRGFDVPCDLIPELRGAGRTLFVSYSRWSDDK